MKNINCPIILAVGTLPPPIHGQAVAFSEAVMKINNIKYVVNNNFINYSKTSKIVLNLTSLFKVSFYLLTKKIDIVYFTSSRSVEGSLRDIFLLFICKVLNKKTVNHVHGAEFKQFFDSCGVSMKYLIKKSYDKISAHIVLYEKMKEQYEMLESNSKFYTIPNFYEARLENLPKNKSDFNKSELVFTYLSNLTYSKGIIHLLEAFHHLSLKYPNIKLKIAGKVMSDDIKDRSFISSRLSDYLGLNDRIEFLGIVEGDEKLNLLSNTDIFVLPTFYKTEGLPFSIIEAMRAGALIITTKHNYLPMLVTDKIGVLIEPDSVPDLEINMEYFINNPDSIKKFIEHNINTAISKYSSEKYLSGLKKVFYELAQGHPLSC